MSRYAPSLLPVAFAPGRGKYTSGILYMHDCILF